MAKKANVVVAKAKAKSNGKAKDESSSTESSSDEETTGKYLANEIWAKPNVS
jgi:hypothetical protein